MTLANIVIDSIESKQKISNALIEMSDIFTLIDNPEIIEPAQMINKNIFSYIKTPSSVAGVKNCICFDYNTKISETNSNFRVCSINIQIICHEDTIHTDYGNRHDVLGGIINNSFNWSDILGFDLELVSDSETMTENQYLVRVLQFTKLLTNNICNKVGI